MNRNLTRKGSRPAIPEVARRIPLPLHPSYEDLMGFVAAGQQTQQWTPVAQHLQICPRCAEEVRDLRALEAQLNHMMTPAPVAARPLGFFEWFRAILAFPPASPAFAVASAFAMLIGVLAIWPDGAGLAAPDAAGINGIHDILQPTNFAPVRVAAGWILAAGGTCGILYNLISRNKK